MSDNIVKHGQLSDIAQDLWTIAKKRDIESFEFDSTTKTLKGKNSVDTALSIDVELTDLVSINDRAKFKQDVSVDKAGAANNLHIGTLDGDQSRNRILGYRGLTSSSFVDGYVSELIVYAKSDLPEATPTNWNVWAIKKGATKEQDTVKETFHRNNVQVQSITINGQAAKCVRFTINREFSEAVYFMARCVSHEVKTCIPTDGYKPDVVNMSNPPSDTVDTVVDWRTNNPANTAVMYLVGRESIASLAEKLRKTQADGSNYVLQSETTATGGAGSANKVARLGGDGKLDKDMLPAIAINEYFTASDFTNAALANLTYQNGDVVVVTKDTITTRYLCVNKTSGANSTDHFVPLNSKDGVVTKVNNIGPGADGNVTVTSENISYTGTIGGAEKTNVKAAIDALNEEAKKGIKTIKNGRPGTDGNIDVTVAEGGATGITMTFGTDGAPIKVVTYMTEQEVTAIKNLFV